MSRKTIVLLVLIGFLVSMYAPIAYAGKCTPFKKDWFRPDDLIQDPPFVQTDIINVHIADFTKEMCGFWVVYREDSVIFVDAQVKEDGKIVKKRIRLTKEIEAIWSDFVEIVYIIKLKNIKEMENSKYSHFKKTEKNIWKYIDSRPAVMFSMESENCEVKDLNTGQVLRTAADGYFISNNFIITELTNTALPTK